MPIKTKSSRLRLKADFMALVRSELQTRLTGDLTISIQVLKISTEEILVV